MKRILSSAAMAGVGAFLLSVVGFGGAANALSISPLLQLTNPVSSLGLGDAPYTLGWEFQANRSVTINALGVFDAGGDGLANSYQVGLWNSAGVQIASATVANGKADPLVAQFRWAGITTPVTLAGGQNYYVGALYQNSSDPVVGSTSGGWPNSGFVTSPLITYIAATWGGASVAGGEGTNITTLTWPKNAFGSPGFFSANIATTPIPAALPLFGGGLALVALLARRRRQTPRAA